MAFTLKDSQSSTAIPAGEYEISIVQAYEDKGPIEGISAKDDIPYYMHGRRYQAKIVERLSEDDDEGNWEGFQVFNGATPTFTFELSVGEKFLDDEMAKELIAAIPEDNDKRRDMVRNNIQSARRGAQQLLRCFDEDTDFFEVVDNLVGENFKVSLTNYTRKDDSRTYYNVNFNSLVE